MGMLLSRHYKSNNDINAEGVANTVAPSSSAEKNQTPTITASEISKMTGAKLRKLAKENGIADPEELTVGELKAVLTDKLCG